MHRPLPALARTMFLALLIAMVGTTPVLAGGGGGGRTVERRGDCDGRGEWKIVVRREDSNTLRVRLLIHEVRPGQTWAVFLSDNGHRFFSNTIRASSSGEVKLTKFPVDRPGSDRIVAAGVNHVTGDACTGSATF
jgi:hypothetical protein